MNNLFPYLCSSCASPLTINDERKIMICNACGSVYDYDYFLEDKLLEMADLAFIKGEFASASEMYSFMIDKEPQNFRALKGLMLSDHKVSDLSVIPAKLNDGSFFPVVKNFERYKKTCPSDKVEYFEKAEQILRLGCEYTRLSDKIEADKKERKGILSQIDNNVNKSYEHYSRTRDGSIEHPKNVLVTMAVLFLVTELFVLILAASLGARFLLLIIGASAIIVVPYAIPIVIEIVKIFKINKILKANVPLKAEHDKLSASIEENRTRNDEIMKEIKKLLLEVRKLK